jgi:hypothetical protein
MTFAGRRRRNIAIILLVALALSLWLRAYTSMLHHPQWLSGWLLVGVIAFLTLYNVRKKLSMLPIGRNAVWLQLHLYVGLLSGYLFGEHLGWSLPNGGLEWALALLFTGVIVTGVVGIYLSRRLPKDLTRRGEEVIFERIPLFRAELRQQAQTIVLRAASDTGSSTLADYYASRLETFFEAPRNYIKHVLHIGRPLFGLTNDIRSQHRYLNDKEREYAERLLALVEQKDELDFHHALQSTLKGWLFVHVPLTYSMIIVAVLHVVLVYAFGSF